MTDFWKKPFLPLITAVGRKIEEKKFTKEPILVGGCGRSGTTLLLSILSAHPEVFACPNELGIFNKIQKTEDGEIHPERIDRLYRTFISNQIKPTATRWCEKSPSNVKHIDDIDRYFDGKFKFIHLIRDGRDVVLSVHPTAPDRYWVDPERWVNDVSIGLHFRSHPNVLTVFYEDLILEYRKTIAKICEFCGLPLTEEILNWHENADVTKNRAYFSKVKSIHPKSIAKWKRTKDKARIRDFMSHPEAVKLLERLNYLESESAEK